MILVVGLVIVCGHLLTALFRRRHIPDVLVLMVAGVLVGPLVLNLASPADFGKVGPVMTTVSLIVILFEGGIGLDLKSVREAAGETARVTLFTFGATFAIVTGIGWLLLRDATSAAMLGAILAGTSSAVVIPMVNALGCAPRARAVLALESALTDVLCIVLTFGLLETAVAGAFDSGRLLGTILSSLVMASVLGFVGAVGWTLALTRVRQLPNSFTSVFAVLFVLYGVAEMLGWSGAITALAFGMTIGNPPLDLLAKVPGLATLLGDGTRFETVTTTERGLFGEMVFLVKLFFFLYLGLSLTVSGTGPTLAAVGIVAAVYLARLVLVRLALDRSVTRRDAAIAAIMVPKGLAAAVLASVPAQRGLAVGPAIQETAFAAVGISILVTAVLVPLVENPRTRGLRDALFRPFSDGAEAEAERAA